MPTTREEGLAAARRISERAVRWHRICRGKVQVLPKCPVRDAGDFSVWYTPGVAASCRAIEGEPELVYEQTNRANTVAIVSDGSRVLGLGDIGPEAGLPVMEGKALLFKYLGGVDAVPLCIRVDSATELIRTVRAIEPSFGGINLEDIAQPKCFEVLDSLRSELRIPVWHDDQQGTATVLLAGLLNALLLVGKDLARVKIAMVGMGAANVAVYRLLKRAGIDPRGVVACDSRGTLHRGRLDIEARQDDFKDKWRVCLESNAEGIVGGIEDAMRGADVCIAYSKPDAGTIRPEWIEQMAPDPVVFACANPVPEIWPWDAREAGARIVGTGRTDFPNQLNNSLAFPGIFRGVLDIRARAISDGMAMAAARELAAFASERGLEEEAIVPHMDEWDVFPRVAAATAVAAQQEGLAGIARSGEQLHEQAAKTIREAREATECLMRSGLMPEL